MAAMLMATMAVVSSRRHGLSALFFCMRDRYRPADTQGSLTPWHSGVSPAVRVALATNRQSAGVLAP
jgi:hypothetical protein